MCLGLGMRPQVQRPQRSCSERTTNHTASGHSLREAEQISLSDHVLVTVAWKPLKWLEPTSASVSEHHRDYNSRILISVGARECTHNSVHLDLREPLL